LMAEAKQNVAVVGASSKSERYSKRAVRLLVQHGHSVFPVNPREELIEGISVIHRLEELSEHINTVTIYVAPERSTPLEEVLVALRPDRVIFNPGAENPKLQAALEANGIKTMEACTLVLLKTGQF